MKNKLSLLFCLFLLLIPCRVFAAEEALGTTAQTFTLDLWHYSGGYWNVGNKGSEKIRITDSEMASLGGIEGTLEAGSTARFEMDLPGAVQAALAEGKDVHWRLKPSSVPLDELFDLTTLSEVSMDGDILSFIVKPRFHVSSGYTLNDFIPGLSVTIPLIDEKYGYNMYSVFGGGLNGQQCDGRFRASEPEKILPPFIHPLMIEDKSGTLQDGQTVICYDRVLPSDGMCIGQGTFAAAGACGLSFSFPVSVEFYAVTGGSGDDPGQGDDPSGPDDPGHGDDPGQGGDPQGPDDPGHGDDPQEPDEPEHSAAIDAVLDLPNETFEGHSVEATDCSVIGYDEDSYTAETAYKKGIASNSFSVDPREGVTERRTSKTTEEIRFDNAGYYHVKLTVNSAGQSDSDFKEITVKRCPAVSANLSGLQKQNRRQVLSGSVAQNPKYPIVRLTVKITDKASGESILVSKHLDGSTEDAPANSAHIKYRSIADGGSDEYYRRFSLEFLSKFDTDREFSFTVYAEDSRGYTDSLTQDFTVKKDEPPKAIIDLAERFYRGEGGTPAEIETRDKSESDGDRLLRTWRYSENGRDFVPLTAYEDLSFGTLQEICLKKADVGGFSIQLTVTDDWKGDTLEEYISAEDFLSDTAVAHSVVDNIAPKVSLSLNALQRAEVLLLAGDEASYRALLAAKNELQANLIEEGIDAKITAASMAGASSVSGRVSLTGSRECAFGFQGRWPFDSSFWEMYSSTADERRLYKASCSWPIGEDEFDCYAAQPYVITAYDRDGLKTLWTFTLGKDLLNISFDQARFGHDFEGRYLYIKAAGKTVLIDKDSGAFVGVISGDLGFSNSVTDRSIYAYKSDGIYRYPRSGGAPAKILDAQCYADADQAVQLGGKVCFLVKRGSRLYLAHFDPQSEEISYTYLQGTGDDAGTAATKLLGIDSSGVCVIDTDTKVRVFGKDGALLRTLPGGENSDAVYDASGRIRYITVRTDQYYAYKGDEIYRSTVNLYAIYSSYSASQTISDESDYPTDVERLCVSFEGADGKVYIGCGAWFDYVRWLGMPYGQRFRIFTFDTKTGSNTNADVGAFCGGLPANIEWSQRTQGAYVLSCAYNHPYSANNTTYLVNISESRADMLSRLKMRYLNYEADRTVVREISGSIDPAALAAEIARECEAGGKSTLIEGTNTEASIRRELKLEAGKTYYYEYDTSASADILSVQASFSRSGNSAEGYAVKAEYFEDFNGPGQNAFFRLGAGTIKDAAFFMADLTRDGYIDRSGSLSFTVPDGYSALLSFDYNAYSQNGNGYSFFSLSRNGTAAVRWEDGGAPTRSRSSGSYLSKHLLSSGNYTLQGTIKSYSNSENNRCYLTVDNVRVLLLKKENYASALTEDLKRESHISDQNGLHHVSGSFTAPLSVIGYGLLPTDHLTASNCGENHSFTVPDGRTALYAAYVVNSHPYEYYTSSDAYRSVSVSWNWGDERWLVCAPGASGSSHAQSYPASGLKITKYNRTGTQEFEGNIPYRTSGSIESFEAFLSKPGAAIPSSVSNERFFLDGAGLYYEDKVFGGNASLTIAAGAGDELFSSLRIYTIEDGKRSYLCDASMKTESELSGWTKSSAEMSVTNVPGETERIPELIYDKGEYVDQQVSYTDREDDPSKESIWIYEHTAYNDGTDPISGAVLHEPVNRFYYDGRYELLHWEYDDTGKPEFDKMSNVCRMIFYIRGGSAPKAPWIEYITTDPAEIEAGDNYRIEVGVGDENGKTLELEVELFLDGELIESFRRPNIVPDANGKYPAIFFDVTDPAAAGQYDIVATVRSDVGADIDSYQFTVENKASIEGFVDHTAQWEANRRDFNTERFSKDYDDDTELAEYRKLPSPRPRYRNVFWNDERFVLSALCGGDPVRVTAAIEGHPEYSVRLDPEGIRDPEGKERFSGELWDSSLKSLFSAKTPSELCFVFTAYYADGKTLEYRVTVIVDQDTGYFRLHRKW